MSDEEKVLKVSVPLYTNQELEEFENTLENNYKNIINMVVEQVYKEKECIGLQMVIKKQQEKLEKQNKIIDAMAKRIKEDTDWFYSDLDNMSVEEIKKVYERKILSEETEQDLLEMD